MEEGTEGKDAGGGGKKEADQKDTEAADLETKISETEQKLLKASEKLRTGQQSRAIMRLERDLEKAEAAVGGGISVAVRPSAPVAIRAAVDQQPSIDLQISADRALEAERTIRLAIADLVEVDITAGSADKRQAVEGLRVRWRDEALPLLNK